MKEQGLLFRAEMVRGLLEDRKTETRRLVKPQPYIDPKWGLVWEPKGKNHPTGSPSYCERNTNWNPITEAFADFYRDKGGSPYGKAGDRIWVKETHYFNPNVEPTGRVRYRADDLIRTAPGVFEMAIANPPKWRPSIFMPRWASRITLEITGIRVERLKDISERDAIAEGIERDGDGWKAYVDGNLPRLAFPQNSYKTLWQSINGMDSWDLNPWVWVIKFKRIPVPG